MFEVDCKTFVPQQREAVVETPEGERENVPVVEWGQNPEPSEMTSCVVLVPGTELPGLGEGSAVKHKEEAGHQARRESYQPMGKGQRSYLSTIDPWASAEEASGQLPRPRKAEPSVMIDIGCFLGSRGSPRVDLGLL